MNVIFIVDRKPDSSRYYTERFGVDCCVIEMRSELTNKVHTVVDDCIVKKVLKDGMADIGEKYMKAIAECASDYTDKIMRKCVSMAIMKNWQSSISLVAVLC